MDVDVDVDVEMRHIATRVSCLEILQQKQNGGLGKNHQVSRDIFDFMWFLLISKGLVDLPARFGILKHT